MDENIDYEKYAKEIFKEIVNDRPNIKSMKNPMGIILGGQHGSGKSNLIREKVKEFDGNLFVISGDDYRKYHPFYNDFQKIYGKDSVTLTAKFAGAITELLIKKAIQNKYNVVIEGTFRTAEVPIQTLSMLKQNGYTTQVLVQICDKELSWKNCLERYEKMCAANPLEARYTKKEHHDLVVNNITDSIQKVYDSKLAESFESYERKEQNIKQIFNSKRDKILDVKKYQKILNHSEKQKSIPTYER